LNIAAPQKEKKSSGECLAKREGKGKESKRPFPRGLSLYLNGEGKGRRGPDLPKCAGGGDGKKRR